MSHNKKPFMQKTEYIGYTDVFVLTDTPIHLGDKNVKLFKRRNIFLVTKTIRYLQQQIHLFICLCVYLNCGNNTYAKETCMQYLFMSQYNRL